MQDFKWTTELVNEFFDSVPDKPGTDLFEFMQQFKSSKSPKKEWEIVAVRSERFNNEIRQLPEGVYFEGGYDKPERGWQIHSVRRLSDGEVFSVGDRLQNYATPITEITTKGWVDGIGFNCGEYGEGCSLSRAKKLPQPILTTVDGVEIFEGDRISIVFDDFGFVEMSADDCHLETYKQCLIFSTSKAANAFITENKPLLSLNDVKEWVEAAKRSNLSMDFILEKAERTARQKLNQ